MTLIIILLILWAAFSVAGFLIEGILWLAWIGIILFVVTAIWGALKNRFKKTT